MNLAPYLEDLEARIDDRVEDELLNQWIKFVNGEWPEEFFRPARPEKSPPKIDWPNITINEAIADHDKMILSQLASCSATLAAGTGKMLCVRSNYGTSILPSLFGVKLFFMDDRYNTLPTSYPIENGKEGIRELLKQGVPDLSRGLGAKTLEMGQRFVEVFAQYPKIKKHVHIYHPDLQGPMDVCEVIWGSQLFLDIMDEPNLVKDFLELITETYIAFMKEWQRIVPPQTPWSVHWGVVQKGQVMLRNDSAVNFSPGMFAEFFRPYDQRILEEFGGGSMHYCGRGDHFVALAAETKGLYAFNLGQPELNDLKTIYEHSVARGIQLLDFPVNLAQSLLEDNYRLYGRVHCR